MSNINKLLLLELNAAEQFYLNQHRDNPQLAMQKISQMSQQLNAPTPPNPSLQRFNTKKQEIQNNPNLTPDQKTAKIAAIDRLSQNAQSLIQTTQTRSLAVNANNQANLLAQQHGTQAANSVLNNDQNYQNVQQNIDSFNKIQGQDSKLRDGYRAFNSSPIKKLSGLAPGTGVSSTIGTATKIAGGITTGFNQIRKNKVIGDLRDNLTQNISNDIDNNQRSNAIAASLQRLTNTDVKKSIATKASNTATQQLADQEKFDQYAVNQGRSILPKSPAAVEVGDDGEIGLDLDPTGTSRRIFNKIGGQKYGAALEKAAFGFKASKLKQTGAEELGRMGVNAVSAMTPRSRAYNQTLNQPTIGDNNTLVTPTKTKAANVEYGSAHQIGQALNNTIGLPVSDKIGAGYNAMKTALTQRFAKAS